MVQPITGTWMSKDMTNRTFGKRPGHDAADHNGATLGKGALAGAGASRAVAAPTPSDAAPRTGARIGMDEASVCRLMSLLADKTRLKILKLLAEKERHVGALTAELGLPQPTVSHHLAWLRTVGLVSPRRAGKFVFYALGPAAEIGSDGQLTLHAADAVVTISQRRAE